MMQCFLSYARTDRGAARRLYEGLRRTPGIKLWFDEEDLPAGVRWKPEIRKVIRESDKFIALFSRKSSSERGYRNSELRQGLEIAQEFPDGWVFLLPTRLEDCQPPIEGFREYNFTDLFPDWDRGVDRLRAALASPRAPRGRDERAPDGRGEGAPPARHGVYHYRLGLALLDRRTPELQTVAEGLNAAQSFFSFSLHQLAPSRRALRTIEGHPQLDVARLSSIFYRKIAPLEMDHVICLTHRFLAFEDDTHVYWNYLGCTSKLDERVAFLSTRDRAKYAARSGVDLETALAYGIVVRLTSYLLDVELHDEIRGCPLDFTEDHALMVEGLRNGRFCDSCAARFERNPPLQRAMQAMLRWNRG